MKEKLHKEMVAELANKTKELEAQNRRLKEEIEKRQIQEALVLKAKQEWERTIDSIPDMITIVDREHRILRVNKAMLDMLGTSYQEFVGTHCFGRVHGCNAPPGNCPHVQLLKDGKSHSVEIYEEHLGGHCEVLVFPYRDPDGTLLGSVHIVRDINERKKSEKEREELHARLLQAQKLESVGRLASGIAHEINTPIQFIGSNIEFVEEAVEEIKKLVLMFLEQTEEKECLSHDAVHDILQKAEWEYLAEELPSALTQTKQGIDRVSKIVNAMKEFSHPGSRSKTKSQLNNIIETTVIIAKNEWKYIADMKLDLDPDLPEVDCLVDEMGQVLLNMIVNAAHAITAKYEEASEQARGTITIATTQADTAITLTISDDGTGIPETIIGKIFEPFFTTKQVGTGTGQGLAIAMDVVVNKHGGNISVESKPGAGTSFIITIPLSAER